jgi:amino acid transporter
MMPLGGHGFLPKRLHKTHSTNLTPHAAILPYICAIVGFPVILHACGTDPLTIFNDAGTLAAFGFLFAYFMVSVAAPVYLRKLGVLKTKNVVVAVVAFLCLMVPLIGSFYPSPPYPIKLFPYIFAAYVVLGGAWLFAINKRAPGTLARIESDLETTLAASQTGDWGDTIPSELPADLGAAVPATA